MCRRFQFGFWTVTLALVWGADSAMAQPTQPMAVEFGELHISSSNSGGTPFTGININQFVGAERFYNAGFDGSRSIVGNIEAQHVDFGHEALQHVTQQFTGTGALGTVGSHATWVTHTLSGRLATGSYPAGFYGFGIAKGATTWSGAIATSVGSSSFQISAASMASVYTGMLKTGVSGETADIFNSSWGYTGPTGWNTWAVGVDGILNDTGKIGVASAGNDGAGVNTVGGIGAGYNSITVGALGSDTSDKPYNSVSGFSSRSPNDFYNVATNTVVTGVRAAVDITAPGQNLTLAEAGTPNGYRSNLAGTSFSAPIVAGGAALVVDAGKSLYAGHSEAIDGRVVKAVLLNSADKLSNWNNGQNGVGGVIETTQSLDWTSGAGAMNLDRTFDQYVTLAAGGSVGTADVLGLGTGDLGNVSTVGWDFGLVGNTAGINDTNRYFIDERLAAGSDFTVTLTWFADMFSGDDADFNGLGANHLANLDLTIFEFDSLASRNVVSTIARSISLYNVVEHLHFQIGSAGYYGIEVNYSDAHWNYSGETGEFYGLAWRATAVPEPGWMAGAIMLLVVARGRRRSRLRHE